MSEDAEKYKVQGELALNLYSPPVEYRNDHTHSLNRQNTRKGCEKCDFRALVQNVFFKDILQRMMKSDWNRNKSIHGR